MKLFRASDPLLSVLMWGVNHSVSGGTGGRRCRGARGRRELLRPLPGGGAEMHCGSLPPSPPPKIAKRRWWKKRIAQRTSPSSRGGLRRGGARLRSPFPARPRPAERHMAAGGGADRSGGVRRFPQPFCRRRPRSPTRALRPPRCGAAVSRCVLASFRAGALRVVVSVRFKRGRFRRGDASPRRCLCFLPVQTRRLSLCAVRRRGRRCGGVTTPRRRWRSAAGGSV